LTDPNQRGENNIYVMDPADTHYRAILPEVLFIDRPSHTGLQIQVAVSAIASGISNFCKFITTHLILIICKKGTPLFLEVPFFRIGSATQPCFLEAYISVTCLILYFGSGTDLEELRPTADRRGVLRTLVDKLQLL
jgi:hypothetical protein